MRSLKLQILILLANSSNIREILTELLVSRARCRRSRWSKSDTNSPCQVWSTADHSLPTLCTFSTRTARMMHHRSTSDQPTRSLSAKWSRASAAVLHRSRPCATNAWRFCSTSSFQAEAVSGNVPVAFRRALGKTLIRALQLCYPSSSPRASRPASHRGAFPPLLERTVIFSLLRLRLEAQRWK